VLTFHQGSFSTHRRVPAIPQLQCTGGSAQYEYTPEVVQCKNQGFDGQSVQWKCQAEMDEKYRFGKIHVTCEGYSGPNDPYVLVGSCGLQYTLEHTSIGKQKKMRKNKHRRNRNRYQNTNYHQNYDDTHTHVDTSSGSSIFGFIMFVGGIAFLIYVCFFCNTKNPTTQRRSFEAADDIPETSTTASDFQGNTHTTVNRTIYKDYDDGYGRSTNDFVSGVGLGYAMGSRTGYNGYNSGYSGNTVHHHHHHNDSSSSRDYDSESDEKETTTRTTSGFGGSSTR